MNGHGPQDNWTVLLEPSQRVGLRLVNGPAMTTFNVRIPGLPMSVVQADGQNVRPVSVDELQMGVAVTHGVVIAPANRAYTLVGEASTGPGWRVPRSRRAPA